MKKNLIIMYAIAFLQGMVFYGPIATLYRQAQGVTVFEITAIESVSLALAVLLEVPWGLLADRLGYRRTMVFCCGLYFASKIVFWQAAGFGGFLLERVMLSVVQAGMSGVDSSIVYLSCEGRGSQRAFGLYSGIGMLGHLVAAGVFAAFVRDRYSLAGLLTAVSYGLAAALSLGLTEVRRPEAARPPAQAFGEVLRQTLANPALMLFLIAAALLSETHQTITVFLNQLQYQLCGLDSSAIGWIYLAATVLGTLSVLSSFVTRRTGVRGALLLCGAAASLSALTLALSRRAAPSVAAVLTLRVSHALFEPLQAEIRNREIQTAYRATALSIHAMLVNGVAIATNLIFGALSDRKLPSAFLFGAGICAASLPLFLAWHRRSAAPR